MSDIHEITQKLVEFRDKRNWEQFHNSKDLALAISIEASELNELFLWKKEDEAEMIDMDKLREELADILAFCFLLAHKHELDVKEIVLDKICQNDKKYPVEKSRNSARKYNTL
jgi:NTP pyrophosphatase (non-canonical NTP hydrolase)